MYRLNNAWLICTARIRSTREGNVLTCICVSVYTRGGYPILPDRGYPHHSWWGYIPHPSQWIMDHLRSGQASYPHSRSVQGYPIPGEDGGTPSQVKTRGTLGYPHLGQVPGQDGGTPNWNNTACTCYMAGSMPLACMEEGFLVVYNLEHSQTHIWVFHNRQIREIWQKCNVIFTSYHILSCRGNDNLIFPVSARMYVRH